MTYIKTVILCWVLLCRFEVWWWQGVPQIRFVFFFVKLCLKSLFSSRRFSNFWQLACLLLIFPYMFNCWEKETDQRCTSKGVHCINCSYLACAWSVHGLLANQIAAFTTSQFVLDENTSTAYALPEYRGDIRSTRSAWKRGTRRLSPSSHRYLHHWYPQLLWMKPWRLASSTGHVRFEGCRRHCRAWWRRDLWTVRWRCCLGVRGCLQQPLVSWSRPARPSCSPPILSRIRRDSSTWDILQLVI